MAKNGRQERQRFWRNLIGRQPASGLSIARFCQQAGVSANSFFVWKRRLRSQAAAVENGKTAPEHTANPARRSPRQKTRRNRSFIPVRLIADPVDHNPSNAIEVQWPTGLVLRVPSGFDAGTLREVLRGLQPSTDAEAPSC